MTSERAKPEVLRAFKHEKYPSDGSVDWDAWKTSLEFAFDAAGIEHHEDQRALLLGKLGPEGIQLLTSLMFPKAVKESTFKEIVDKLDAHPTIKESNVIAVERFRNRKQGSDAAQDWIADLRRLASRCKFGTEFESQMCSQIVRGIASTPNKIRLMETRDLNLDKAIELLTTWELARESTLLKIVVWKRTNL